MKKITPQYLTKDGVVRVVKLPDSSLQSTVPPAIYRVCKNDSEYYLEHVANSFELPAKIYGSSKARAKRTVETFLDRTSTTGVSITGLKGAGKTDLAKLMCNKVIKHGYPVLLINDPFVGAQFNTFIKDIGICATFHDEFAKTFSRNMEGTSTNSQPNQDQLLTLFDGADAGQRLMIIVENQIGSISDLYFNRPGRIFYNYEFRKIEDEVVTGFVKDQKLPKKFAKEMVDYSRTNRTLTFDSMKAICEQRVRYGESLEQITAELNVPSFRNKKFEFRITKLQAPAGLTVVSYEKVVPDFNVDSGFDLMYVRSNKLSDGKIIANPDSFEFSYHDITYTDGKKVIYEDAGWTILGEIFEVTRTPITTFESI